MALGLGWISDQIQDIKIIKKENAQQLRYSIYQQDWRRFLLLFKPDFFLSNCSIIIRCFGKKNDKKIMGKQNKS